MNFFQAICKLNDQFIIVLNFNKAFYAAIEMGQFDTAAEEAGWPYHSKTLQNRRWMAISCKQHFPAFRTINRSRPTSTEYSRWIDALLAEIRERS